MSRWVRASATRCRFRKRRLCIISVPAKAILLVVRGIQMNPRRLKAISVCTPWKKSTVSRNSLPGRFMCISRRSAVWMKHQQEEGFRLPAAACQVRMLKVTDISSGSASWPRPKAPARDCHRDMGGDS